MEIKQYRTGFTIDGKDVMAVLLTNAKGTAVTLFNYGLIINKFIVSNKYGESQDIVLGFDDFEGYINQQYLNNYPYLGAIIGRYANRIKGGKFEIEGQFFQVAQNKGNDTLHGGKEGFDRKIWDILSVNEEKNAVTFQYESKDEEEGFPGNLIVQLEFRLTDDNELILNYQALTDKATPVNLTHHSYFNLCADGSDVKNHFHQMYASNWLEQDSNYVVTGNLMPVEGTMHDFKRGKYFSENWDENLGYDQTYVLDKNYGDLTLASETSCKNSGLKLQIYTTEPVAHLYTAKYLDVKNGKNNKDYHEFDAFCIETQHHPNAVNIPDFPNTVLYPESSYKQTTIYKIVITS
ncbi:aldose epimerase family protein [Pedobacter montanisoli]|uniref:Aldose 1-epimerase n=1 Tax=Pedobacter montanisoli TaxID=2923277 RepID=A0ABS9ZY41_9SPHI|nr:aldose epimerase family protein [Pedobacter montanisoli]MCJ0743237.1 galactose mutarotase [Pedobacter montanisoli]